MSSHLAAANAFKVRMLKEGGQSNRIKIRARWYTENNENFLNEFSNSKLFRFEIKRKKNLSVSFIGKSKTTIQIIAISTLILSQEVRDIWIVAIFSLWFAAIFSLYSLFTYVSEWFKHYLN